MAITTIYEYMRHFATELGERILETFAPLQSMEDPVDPAIYTLKRAPFRAQEIAIMGVAKYLKKARSAKFVAECGAGKTLMALGAAHVHSHGRPYSMLVMCPPHLVHKWAREVLITIPGARAFFIEDLRNGGDPTRPHGVVEVRMVGGKLVRRGLATTLPELRRMGRGGWHKLCPQRAFFIMGKERGKLSYFWKPSFRIAKSGQDLGGLVNPDTGRPVEKPDGGNLTTLDFHDTRVKRSEVINRGTGQDAKNLAHDHNGTSAYSALWQADRTRIQRMAPLDFIGRYMKTWWDYTVADEMHQLAGDTAQGNGLAVLARAGRRLISLTGTMMGGYADDLFNVFYRMDGPKIAKEGFEWGSSGRQDWQQTYGVIETVETTSESDNACSRAKKRSIMIRRRPGCSPLLFGKHLMENTAFVSLEDISDQLPPYQEKVISVGMDVRLAKAYEELEVQIKATIKEHPKDKALRSIMLNALLAYPDHPFGWKTIQRKVYDFQSGEFVVIDVADPQNLKEEVNYAKEQRLVEKVKKELQAGRRVQVYATYTGQHDVTARIEQVLTRAGIRVAVLRSTVPTEQREAWYERRLREGVEVVVCHPRLVETGLDLYPFPTLIFYETGYSLHTLRQASRRSWRIGQSHPVRVLFFTYRETMQDTCIRLMGKKMLVAMMMEGKFSGEGLQAVDEDDDMLSAMARELVEKAGVGASADAIWHDLERERSKHLADNVLPPGRLQEGPAVTPGMETPHEELLIPETPAVTEAPSIPPAEFPTMTVPPPAAPVSFLAYTNPRPKRKKAIPFSTPDAGQLPLFGS
jgi:hypothetical protein